MDITVRIGDADLKCSLGLAFLGELLDATDMSIEEVGEKMARNPFKLLPQMIYHSHATYMELDGKEPEYDLRGIMGLIEKDGGLSSEGVADFLSKWTKSMTKDVPESKGGGEAKK